MLAGWRRVASRNTCLTATVCSLCLPEILASLTATTVLSLDPRNSANSLGYVLFAGGFAALLATVTIAFVPYHRMAAMSDHEL